MKRGMNWHISSVVTRNKDTNELGVSSYVHLFNSCTQDWFAVASIIENLLEHIKTDNPSITKVYLRSDEAGCYHNNLLLAALNDIGARVGLHVHRYDFSEPQQGKDICDRIICPLKASVRRYCNEGNDVLDSLDMHLALKQQPVRGTAVSVNNINNRVEQLKVKKLSNFSAFHNVEYGPNSITVWKAYGIGKGKTIPLQSIYISHQISTDMEVIQTFSSPVQSGRVLKKKAQTDTTLDSFECKEPGCNLMFGSLEEAEHHMDVGEHTRFVDHESVYDTIRREWGQKFRNVDDASSATITQINSGMQDDMGGHARPPVLTMGWALAKPRGGSACFPKRVREYLDIKFDFGERTGSKADPGRVALEMRQARDKDGNRLFNRDEWLTRDQIKGYFSRLAKSRKKAATSNEDGSSDEEEEDRNTLVNNIVSALAVRHPIFYDAYDLCDMCRQKKLGTFKVPMLKEICSYFEIPFKSRDRKGDLVKLLEDMVKTCSCFE